MVKQGGKEQEEGGRGRGGGGGMMVRGWVDVGRGRGRKGVRNGEEVRRRERKGRDRRGGL